MPRRRRAKRRNGGFQKLTPQQRACLKALHSLGGLMVANPSDARPLRALQRRGLVRFRHIDGVRHAVLRKGQQRARKGKAVPRGLAALIDRLWAGFTGAGNK